MGLPPVGLGNINVAIASIRDRSLVVLRRRFNVSFLSEGYRFSEETFLPKSVRPIDIYIRRKSPQLKYSSDLT